MPLTTGAALTPRSLLIRGMLAGLIAGLLAFVFVRFFGEPSVNAAIAFEATHAPAGAGEEPELVSRGIQANLGLVVAYCLYAAAIGGIFALVFAFVYGRVGRVGARAAAAALAVVGFGSVFLIPYLKYPPNPPAVGQGETIGQRSGLYLLMVAISIAAAIAGLLIRRSVLPQRGSWDAAIAGFLSYVVIVSIAAALLPAINEVPSDFSGSVLWEFRVASLGSQVVLWTVIAVVFGALVERVERRATQAAVTEPASVG